MSEWCAIYFCRETLSFTDCKSLTVGSSKIKEKINILEITRPKGAGGLTAKAYCDGKEVPILKDNEFIIGAYYSGDYMFHHQEEEAPGQHYWLKTVDKRIFQTHESEFEELAVKCEQCGANVFPEPEHYCDHILFVYAEDFEGLWVYVSDEARLAKIESAWIDMDRVITCCAEFNWKVDEYRSVGESTFGHTKLMIGCHPRSIAGQRLENE